MNNRIGVNILANYFGKLWGFISVYIFIPVYIDLLGIENYALINFHAVLLSIMLIADVGLSATLNREISRTEDQDYLANLLRTVEYIYLGIASIVLISILLFSDLIAEKWLNVEDIPLDKVSMYIKIMGATISFQLLTILYHSGLMGLQKQVTANTLQVLSSLFRQGVVIIPLYFIRSLDVFFIWQFLMNLVFFYISRRILWKQIKTNISPAFNKKIFQITGKFTTGMMFMAVIAAINTQIDKIFVSKLLSLKVYGYYSLAGVFAQSSVMLLLPIAVAILPKMTKLAEQKDTVSQEIIFHRYSFVIATVACSVTMVLFVFTDELIFLWTHDLNIVENVKYIAKILLIGGMFLGLQYMPYHLAIANGHTKTNVIMGVAMVILFIPGLYFSISTFGVIGASFPWAILNFAATFYLAYFILKKFLKNNFSSWLFLDTLIPIATCSILGIVFYLLTKNITKEYHVLLLAGSIGFISLLVNALIYIRLYLKLSLNEFYNVYVKK